MWPALTDVEVMIMRTQFVFEPNCLLKTLLIAEFSSSAPTLLIKLAHITGFRQIPGHVTFLDQTVAGV